MVFMYSEAHTRYTGIIITDTGVHQILKVTKYTGILQNSMHNSYKPQTTNVIISYAVFSSSAIIL